MQFALKFERFAMVNVWFAINVKHTLPCHFPSNNCKKLKKIIWWEVNLNSMESLQIVYKLFYCVIFTLKKERHHLLLLSSSKTHEKHYFVPWFTLKLMSWYAHLIELLLHETTRYLFLQWNTWTVSIKRSK